MSENISAEMVMTLRKRTGVGMSQCKEALVEAKGDVEEAIHILRKKGIASAIKKGARETNEGVIGIAQDDKCAYLVEVNAETDFVIQNERFKEFLQNICNEALTANPETLEDFMHQKYSKNPSLTIDEYRAEIVHSLGENIQIRRIRELKKESNQSVGIYSHMGGKIVTAIVIDGSSECKDLAHGIAMHIAAESPEYLREEDVPVEVLKKEEEIARSQVQNKPAEIIDKIVGGKIKAFYEQACLVNQKFVKEPTMTIAEVIEKEGKKLGKKLQAVEFLRWQIGE